MSADNLIEEAAPRTFNQLEQTWRQLQQTSVWVELGILLACLILAWLVVRAWRGRQGDVRSIWLGRNVFDGALFPALALGLAILAERLFQHALPMAVFKVAIPVLTSLALIRITVKVLGVVFPNSRAMRILERTVSWGAWLATVLWVTGLLPVLLADMEGVTWRLGGTVISLRAALEGLFNAILVMILALSLSSAIESRLLGDATTNLSLRKMVSNAMRSILLVVGVILAMASAGIDITALSVFGGAFGVGLGLGLQRLAANYVSGFVILAERSLSIGDLVKVDNFEGVITDINTRYTVLKASSGREAILPNESLITQRVENASLSNRRVSVSTAVQVAYGTDLRALFPELLEAIRTVHRVLQEPAPSVQLTSFGTDGLDLTISFWVGDPENGIGMPKSDVNMAILDTLNRLNIEIPFPQRVLHHATPVSIAPHEVSSQAP